jgi:ATP-dependent Clp protease ATP-binding subunit ClpB
VLSVNSITFSQIETAVKEIRGGAKVTDDSPESKFKTLERYGIDLIEMAARGNWTGDRA